MAFADTEQLTVQLDLKGNLKAGLRDASRAIKGFDKATSNTQRSLGKFGRNIERGVAVGLAATAAGFVGVVKAAADYESAFAGVRKTVTATEPQLKQLSEEFRQLAKTIPISASELARLGEAGGALGVPTDQLKEFVRVTALLGVTTNLTSDQAAESLGVLGNVLKLTGADYERFASSLVALGNAGASTETAIIEVATRAGAAGKLIGLAKDQVLGFASAAASLDPSGIEAAGTSLQKFFIDSTKAVASGGDKLKIFAKTAGVSAKAFAGAFNKDAGKALQDFLAGLGKLSKGDQLAVLEDLDFNDARITRTLLGLANNTELVSSQMDIANKAFKENTALTKEANERFNTFDSQLILTKNHLTDIAITIGPKLLPKITPLLKRLNDFVSANQDKISEFGDKLAAGFEKFADALGKVDWAPFIEGLRVTSEIAKTAIGLFMSLPAEVKAVAIGAFAVNKVTGGLPTSIAKDAGGALLQQFAARGSSPANPMWVATAGGLPGAPGGKGGIGGALKGLIPIAVAAAAVEVAGSVAGVTRDSPNRTINNQGNIVRAVSDVGQKITALQAAEKQLAERAAGGDTFAAKQLAAVRSELTKLNLGGQAGHFSQLSPVAKDARQKDDIVNLIQLQKGTNALLRDQFRQMVKGLKGAKNPAEIRSAVAAAVALVVGKGRGNVASTKGVLADLRAKLTLTDDPKTRAEIKAAIAKVERKVQGREWAQKQLAKADAILKSTASGARKIEDLKAIEGALLNRGLPAAAARIREKIDQAKQAQVAAAKSAGQQAAFAIRDKDLSVSIGPTNITVNTRVSLRETIKTQTTFKKLGGLVAS